MQGVKDPAARDAAMQEVGKLYERGLTYQAISDETGLSLPTIRKYVNALLETGAIARRPDLRGEGRRRYLDSPEGQAERRRLSEAKRTAPPVKKVCECCGNQFEQLARRVGRDPGRFCSRPCFDEWTRRELASTERRRLLADGRARWTATRQQHQASMHASGYLTLDETIAKLPPTMRRTRSAVVGHIADGGLVAERDGYGQWWISRAAIPAYLAWIKEHPDGRLRRFNADNYERAKIRTSWTGGRHGARAKQRVSGQLNSVLVGPRSEDGRKRGHDEELEAAIRERSAKGHSIRQIAQNLGISKTRVHNYLNRKQPAPSRLDEIVAVLGAAPWMTARELAALVHADTHTLPLILNGNPDLFQSRTAADASIPLGRNPNATLWALK